MTVTKHAQGRVRERCGLPKKAVERNAESVLRDGITHAECSGRLKAYVDWLFLSYRTGGHIRLTENHVYIFTSKDRLVTVIPLPRCYRKAVGKITRRRKKGDTTICSQNREEL